MACGNLFTAKLIESGHAVVQLQSHLTTLENTVRWRWTQGDVAIWDNVATQHYVLNDHGDQHRVVRRVTVAGPAAVGWDGTASVQLSES